MPLKPFFFNWKNDDKQLVTGKFPFFQNPSFGGAQGLFKVQAKLGAPRNDFMTTWL
jgi:hypothetical protein